jgi:hypothetical protein
MKTAAEIKWKHPEKGILLEYVPSPCGDPGDGDSWICSNIIHVPGDQPTPGLVGLYQVNATIPADAATGPSVPLTVSIGGSTSNTATIAVQ